MVEAWREEVDSPCTNVCVIHQDSGFCMGCYRTGAEIFSWSSLTDDERRALKAALPGRASDVRGKRRKGRKNRK